MSEETMLDRAPSADDGPMEAGYEPQQAPQAGGFNPDPDKYYYLQADYDVDGKTVTGCFYPVGKNAADAFWDYMAIRPGDPHKYPDYFSQLKFVKMDDQMWYTVEVKADGYHLCMKATGWMYRASYYTAGFLIGDDGQLYVDSWSGPLGCSNSYKLMPDTYFIGADCRNVLRNCRLVEA